MSATIPVHEDKIDDCIVETDVTILGVGAMGHGLASTFLKAGKSLTVWNRSPERASDLVRDGAVLASDVKAAIAASPVTIVVVIDFDAAKEILTDDVLKQSPGRVLVNLVTATESELRDLGVKAGEAGMAYLAGGILSYPRRIGEPETTIFYAGDKETFEKYEALLRILAPQQEYVGTDPAMGQVAFKALYAMFFSMAGCVFETVAFGEKGGVPRSQMFNYAEAKLPVLVETIKDFDRRLASGDFAGDQGTIDTIASGFEVLASETAAANISTRMLDAVIDYSRLAQAAGLGGKDFASAYELILNNRK